MARPTWGNLGQAMKQRQCAACGERFNGITDPCPHCLTPFGATTPPPVADGGPAQLVRIYGGNHAARDFQKDAERLARAGWRVATQSATGVRPGLMAPKGPATISVTYQRG